MPERLTLSLYNAQQAHQAIWLRARGEPIEMLPALDGHGVDIVFRRTSQLTKAECAELSEFVMAWAAERGIYMPAPEGWQ